MLLWRIGKHTPEYSANDLSGAGAQRTGGRWNSKGLPVVYAASAISLAALETMAHLGHMTAIRNAFLVQIVVPGSVWRLREHINVSSLDVTWAAEPPGSTTIAFGDRWLIAARSPLLLVPSVLVPEEFVVLIHPAHPSAAKIKATPVRQFLFDPRL